MVHEPMPDDTVIPNQVMHKNSILALKGNCSMLELLHEHATYNKKHTTKIL